MWLLNHGLRWCFMLFLLRYTESGSGWHRVWYSVAAFTASLALDRTVWSVYRPAFLWMASATGVAVFLSSSAHRSNAGSDGVSLRTDLMCSQSGLRRSNPSLNSWKDMKFVSILHNLPRILEYSALSVSAFKVYKNTQGGRWQSSGIFRPVVSPWWWGKKTPLKRQSNSSKLYGATFQKMPPWERGISQYVGLF
jgi:hypothetical protein